MHLSLRRATPPEQVQTLTDNNAALRVDKARMKSTIADLKAERDRVIRQNKFLRVTVIVLLASIAGLAGGLAISMSGADAGAALTVAISVFSGMTVASISILKYLRL